MCLQVVIVSRNHTFLQIQIPSRVILVTRPSDPSSSLPGMAMGRADLVEVHVCQEYPIQRHPSLCLLERSPPFGESSCPS
jgi:hypothetical protein